MSCRLQTIRFDVVSGLIGLSDELEILISRHANDRDSIQGSINTAARAIVPCGEKPDIVPPEQTSRRSRYGFVTR